MSTCIYVNVYVSTEDAIRNGNTSCGKSTVRIDSWDGWTQGERDCLADLSYNGSPICVSSATTKDLLDAVQKELERRKKIEEERKNNDNLISEKSIIELTDRDTLYYRCSCCGKDFSYIHRRICLPWNLSNVVRDAKMKELRELNQSEANKALSAKEEHENYCWEAKAKQDKQKKDELDMFFREAASGEQVARYERSFLPDKEFMDTIRDFIYKEVDWKRFEPLRSGDHPECDDYNECSFFVHSLEHLTKEEFAAFLKLEAMLWTIYTEKGCTYKLIPRIHIGHVDDYSDDITRKGFLVEVFTPNGSSFSREYAFPE